MNRYRFGLLYGALLLAFTVYILLDTFVIPSVYQALPAEHDVATETEWTESTGESTSPGRETTAIPQSVTQTDTAYADGNISITIETHRVADTTVYVADVVLSSSAYLKTAFAQNAYGRNVTQKTSEIAAQNGALLAINGDFYGSREKGYVLRNGVVYRDRGSANQDALAILHDGSFLLIREEETSIEQMLEQGAEQILSFGPALVANGEVTVSARDEVGKAMRSNPRTAIGIIEPLHYLLVVSDGRTAASEGLSLLELAEFMVSLDATVAYNLDGGGSSTMYFMGQVINNPTTNGNRISERSVSDIVYVGY